MAEVLMAKAQSSAPAQEQKKTFLSPIFAAFSLSVSVVSYLFFSIVVSVLIEWLGMYLGWWGKDHILLTMREDLNYLGANFTTSVFGVPPQEVALLIAKYVNHYLSLPQEIGYQDLKFFRILQGAINDITPYWQTVVYSAVSVAVRCFIVVLSSVLFILVFIVAMVDGLVERELRKDGGGIEHGSLYHYSKKWVGRVLVISPAIYLAWPDAINPIVIIFPSAAAFGFTVYLAFSTFKKYL